MSKYLLNKFLYTVDRDPEMVERYRSEPASFVTKGHPRTHEAPGGVASCPGMEEVPRGGMGRPRRPHAPAVPPRGRRGSRRDLRRRVTHRPGGSLRGPNYPWNLLLSRRNGDSKNRKLIHAKA